MGRPGYPAEFRRRVLNLLAEGRTVASVAHDLDVAHRLPAALGTHHGVADALGLELRRLLAMGLTIDNGTWALA